MQMTKVLSLVAIPILAGTVLAGSPEPSSHEVQPVPAVAPDNGAASQPAPMAGAADSTTQPAKKQYTCPMHPEVSLDQPGKCPKCGMNLVEKKADTAEKEVPKSHDHRTHNHGEMK